MDPTLSANKLNISVPLSASLTPYFSFLLYKIFVVISGQRERPAASSKDTSSKDKESSTNKTQFKELSWGKKTSSNNRNSIHLNAEIQLLQQNTVVATKYLKWHSAISHWTPKFSYYGRTAKQIPQ